MASSTAKKQKASQKTMLVRVVCVVLALLMVVPMLITTLLQGMVY